MTAQPLLSVRNLRTVFGTMQGDVTAVDDVSFDVSPGEVLGIVGESGSGKSVTALSIMGLLPQPPGRVAGGEILFQGRDLLKMPKSELRQLRGSAIGMIFQEPMTSLNPVFTIGDQITETIRVHERIGAAAARKVPHIVDDRHLVATGELRKARHAPAGRPPRQHRVVALGIDRHPATPGPCAFARRIIPAWIQPGIFWTSSVTQARGCPCHW
jgi:ABC-type dipeptide/oligopeptide/nickel transport system ATPase component